MGNAHQSLPFLGALIFLATCAACSGRQDKAAAPLLTKMVMEPTLVMQKVALQSYGTNGLEWRFRAPWTRALTKKNQVFARTIDIQFYEKGKASTRVWSDEGGFSTASAGTVIPKTAENKILGRPVGPGDMVLEGHVVMVSTDGTKLKTDWVQFHKAEELIVSTAPVTILRTDSITEGVGFEAAADLSNVKIYKQKIRIPDEVVDER